MNGALEKEIANLATIIFLGSGPCYFLGSTLCPGELTYATSKKKHIFKVPLGGDMSVPRRVNPQNFQISFFSKPEAQESFLRHSSILE